MGAVFLEPTKRVVFDRTATIANGQTTSGLVAMRGYALRGLITPAGFLGATLTFLADTQERGGKTTNAIAVVDDAGAPLSITVAASSYIVFGQAVAEKLNACEFIAIVAATPQNAARVVTLIGVASAK